MHAPMPNENAIGIFNAALSYYNAPCIGLFFMVSGALLLPIKGDGIDFLKRRFTKIAGPTIFWSIFYIACRYFFDGTSEGIAKSILSIPFSPQGHGVMWFMYTLAGMYLLAPIISPFLVKASKQELNFYLILWAIALCLPALSNVLDVDRSSTGMLYYFSGYVGYFVSGYYMHTFKPHIPNWVLPLLFIVPIACLLFSKLYYDRDGLLYDYFWYLSIFVAMMCVAWFDDVKRLVSKFTFREGGSLILQKLSDCCFGIYLVHIFIMRYILWNIDAIIYNFGGIGQIIFTWVLTFAISFALTWAISYIPYSEYIVGFRTKRK
jgi:surface polysaccharide O-acyltransferase-like enzyme